MEESWPDVVGALTGRSVYNMGMGGYGPNQYSYLLRFARPGPETRHRSLRPLHGGRFRECVCHDSYGLDHWSYLRQDRFESVDADIWREPDDDRVLKTCSGLAVEKQRAVPDRISWSRRGPSQRNHPASGRPANRIRSTTTLIAEDGNIREAFRPSGIRDRLDMNRQEIREGVRITKKLLRDMNEACLKNGSRFVVVVIPTKEMVFADYLEQNADNPSARRHRRTSLERAGNPEGSVRVFSDSPGFAMSTRSRP